MLRDLNTALGLGNPIPKEYLRVSRVEITEVASPTAAPTTPAASTGPERESDEEYAARVRALLEALQSSSATETLKAQIVASLLRK